MAAVKNVSIDSGLYWRLPGPRNFITRIEENAPHARMLWVNLPHETLPGTWDGVEEGLRHAHINNVIKLRIGGGTDIAGEVGVHFGTGRMTASQLMLHNAEQKSAVILMPQGKEGERNCQKYADEFLDSVGKGYGNVLLIVGGHEESLTTDTIEKGIQVIVFDGGLSQDEMDAYVTIRMLNRPGPGSTRLARAIVSEFAGFDVELAEQLIQLSESQLVNITDNLGLLMGESPFRWRYDTWLRRTRSKSMPEVTHTLYVKYLSEHGPLEEREAALNGIKRRYWRACVKILSPWLEARRLPVIRIFSTQIAAEAALYGGKIRKPTSNGKYVHLDPEELEYNNIVGMSNTKKIVSTTPDEICAENVCRLAKDVRDEIAHMRMPSPSDVSDLIREMDRLSIKPL